MQRQMLRQALPSMAENIPDVELSSSIFLTVFPNWHPWGSFNQINYRFRPNGDNHEECIMECMYMEPLPSGERPPAAPIHWLGSEDDWTLAPELGNLARVFNQDSFNVPKVQLGLETTTKKHINLASNGEAKIRHLHGLMNEWLARP